jgi:hypothetical protein
MEGMQMYQLSYVKYCQFIILTFIADLHWATGLWTMGVMLDNNVLPPLPDPIDLTKVGTMIQRNGSNNRRT